MAEKNLDRLKKKLERAKAAYLAAVGELHAAEEAVAARRRAEFRREIDRVLGGGGR